MIRIGVVGYGYWGPNLVRNFAQLNTTELVVVADKNEEQLDRVRSAYPYVDTTTDVENLFKYRLDAVIIATPPPSHFSLAKDCLEHGLHVLVEKPLTLNSQHAVELIDLARQRGLILMVGHTFEYNPAVRKLKEIIDSGELGRLLYIDTVRVNLGLLQQKLNVVWDLAPHDVSILHYLLGSTPDMVAAQGGDCIVEDLHDIAYLNLRFPERVLAHVHISWLDPCKVRRITVVGSKKMAVYDDVEPLEKIKIYDKGVDRIPYTDSFGDFQYSYHYGDVVIPHIRFSEPLRIECQHFIDCITTGQQPQTDGVNGLNVIRVLEAAQQSLENGGGPVHLRTEEPAYVSTT
ncbi:MAG: Gfo/Idh/MocA family protein [Chloroflexota bacterium]